MKPYFTLFIILLISYTSHAQNPSNPDSAKKADGRNFFTSVERAPQFPGGNTAFFRFIQLNLRYPEVAQLIGINGKVNVSFIVDKDGTLKNVHAKDTIGAGCESEAVRVVSSSPRWKPGIQNNIPVKVTYTVAIAFSAPKDSIIFNELKKSVFGFMFEIKGNLYSLDQAESILGKTFSSNKVEIALPVSDQEKYHIPDKKEVYSVKIKST